VTSIVWRRWRRLVASVDFCLFFHIDYRHCGRICFRDSRWLGWSVSRNRCADGRRAAQRPPAAHAGEHTRPRRGPRPPPKRQPSQRSRGCQPSDALKSAPDTSSRPPSRISAPSVVLEWGAAKIWAFDRFQSLRKA
jgi:hypothetical protein